MFLKKMTCLVLALHLFLNPAFVLAQSRIPNQGLQNQSDSLPIDFSTKNQITNLLKGNFDLSGLGQNVASISVHVVGDVNLPGTYRIPIGTRLSTILQSAVPKRQTFRFIKINREDKNFTVDYYRFIYSGQLSDNPFLQENDVINLLGFSKAIRIEGPISRPGVYEIGPEKTVADAINLAGGLTSIYNEGLPINIIRLRNENQKDVFTISQNETKSTPIKANDVIILDSPLNSTTSFDYSLDSLPGEQVFYPTSIPQVYVAGSVNDPGAYQYKKQMKVKDYLGAAGINSNVKFTRPKVLHNNQLVRVSMEDTVNPGDMIITYKKDFGNFRTGLAVVSSVLAITLTSILLNDKLKD